MSLLLLRHPLLPQPKLNRPPFNCSAPLPPIQSAHATSAHRAAHCIRCCCKPTRTDWCSLLPLVSAFTVSSLFTHVSTRVHVCAGSSKRYLQAVIVLTNDYPATFPALRLDYVKSPQVGTGVLACTRTHINTHVCSFVRPSMQTCIDICVCSHVTQLGWLSPAALNQTSSHHKQTHRLQHCNSKCGSTRKRYAKPIVHSIWPFSHCAAWFRPVLRQLLQTKQYNNNTHVL